MAARGFVHPDVGSTPARVVHHENKWRVLHYRRTAPPSAGARPVLLVPSLINRHFILDLGPRRSVVECFLELGRDVFLVDWGAPDDEDRYVTFDDIADRAIARALRVTLRESGADRAHLLGYCLGGTLAAIHASVFPDRIASLTALATPIDFHDEGLLSRWVRTESFDPAALVAATGNVPAAMLQATFQLLRPTLPLAKAMRLLDRGGDERFVDAFAALETWANDNVAFPGAAYRTYVEELYRKNGLVRGTMTLAGRPARLDAIRCPILSIAFPDDPIVPIESARALARLAIHADVSTIERPGGHVGAVVSTGARRDLWPEVVAFFARHDGSKPAKRRARVRRSAAELTSSS
jgi:polyhydroxyalkanoate synthase subunit PhaC